MCIFLWSQRELRTTVADYLRLTKNTIGNIYAVIWHYCGRDLQDRPVIPFSRRLYVVKCDESQFAHKSKVKEQFMPKNNDTCNFSVRVLFHAILSENGGVNFLLVHVDLMDAVSAVQPFSNIRQKL